MIYWLTKAFITAAEPSPHYSHLLSSMKGVIFLGTPHRGAPLAKLLKRVFKATLNSKVCIQQLEYYCETVKEIFSSFNALEVAKHSVSFYESMSMSLFDHVSYTKGPLTPKIVVPKHSAVMGDERCVALNGNHVEITKFRSAKDQNFISVSGNLLKLIEETTNSIST